MRRNLNAILIVFMIYLALTFCPKVNYAQKFEHSISKDYLLIITSYAIDSKYVSIYTDNIEASTLKYGVALDSKIESMGILSLESYHLWRSNLKKILNKHNMQNVKGIILIGQEAWATYLSLDTIPQGIPFYGCNISKTGIEISDTPIDSPLWKPIVTDTEKIAKQKKSCGALFQEFDITSSIDLALRLCPSTKTIAILTDNSYGGVTLLAKFREEMKKNYPNKKIVELDGRKKSIYEINNEINHLPYNSVIMLGTWRVGRNESYFNDKAIAQLVQGRSEIPIFTLTGLQIKKLAIGGCIPKFNEYNQKFIEKILPGIIVSKPDTIYMEKENEIEINTDILKHYGFGEQRLPNNYVVISDHEEQLKRYQKYYNIVILTFIVLGIIVTIILRLLTKLNRQNELLKQQQRDLEVAKEKAERSDRLKSTFLANISHEINTPMNAIVGFINIMEKQMPTKLPFANEIKNATARLSDLLTKMVEFSKVDTGIVEYNIELFNLAEVAEKTSNKFLQQCKTKGLMMKTSIPYTDCQVMWDREKAERIITILTENALKFTPKGSIEIGIFARKDGFIIYVQDSGIGISEANQKKIFYKFEKIDNFSEGAGLGLAYIKAISEKCGGTAKVLSRPDIGSRFIIEIPCKVKSPDKDVIEKYDIANELYNINTLIDSALNTSLKILVAESNDIAYQQVQNNMPNHYLIRAKNGSEAIRTIMSDWFDLALINIDVAVIDGITTAREIRKFDTSTPLIALYSMECNPKKMNEIREAGFNDIVKVTDSRGKLYNAILGLM